MKSSILITGGAGYIGSHASLIFKRAGYNVIIFDNLSTGSMESVPAGCTFVNGDIHDVEKLTQTLIAHKVDAVIHFAAKIIVPESIEKPLDYYNNNTVGVIKVLEAMKKAGVKKIIFSSTAAVYGNASVDFVSETTPVAPTNPYGSSKYFSECIIRDTGAAYGINSVILRYFNVAGAALDGSLGQRSKNATHLIKLACETALGQRDQLLITGTDYNTPDGTGVRDYIHVEDLADVHLLAYEYLAIGGTSDLFNCGYGKGYSVLEVIRTLRDISGNHFKAIKADRRPGDVAMLVAQTNKINSILQWKPKYNDIKVICRTAYFWESFLLSQSVKKKSD